MRKIKEYKKKEYKEENKKIKRTYHGPKKKEYK